MTEPARVDHEHGHGHGGHGHSHSLVDRSIVRSREGVKAVSLSLGVLGAAALVQVLIFALSGSVALLADLRAGGRRYPRRFQAPGSEHWLEGVGG